MSAADEAIRRSKEPGRWIPLGRRHAHPGRHDNPPSHKGPYAIAHSHDDPARCPTCGSEDPRITQSTCLDFPDDFHHPTQQEAE